MKCPLQLAGRAEVDVAEHYLGGDCLREECAWWGTWTTDPSEAQTGCCFPVLTTIFSNMNYRLAKANR